MTNSPHAPVLLAEATAILGLRPGMVACDFTAGYGGHAAEIAQAVGPSGRLVAFDRDPAAWAACRERFAAVPWVSVHNANFASCAGVLDALKIGKIDAALADLGVSSPQLDDAGRGFSYREDGPLDMRMGPDAKLTAAEYLRRTPLGGLVRALKAYGQIRRPHAARALQEYARRAANPTTLGAAEAIKAATPPAERAGKHPARLYFQALRIAVNRELDALDELLGQIPERLSPGGVFAVIAFHSLEADRVKKRFRALCQKPFLPGVPQDLPPAFINLTRRPITPGAQELAANRRARSAQLLAVQKSKDEPTHVQP